MLMTNEETVLSYFFTNIDSDVYCATDNMPISLWALLLGGYSRSDKSLKNRLLQVFNDVASQFNITFVDYIEKLANDIKLGSVDLSDELEKAEKFMAKWAVEYGHNSLKDSSYNMIAIENVSIRASKILEDSKLSAFQEKSTRYMDFSGDSFLETSEEVDSIHSEAMKVYSEAKDELVEYYKSVISREEFKTENAWIRTCNAKAFDDARYLLPTSIRTSLGATMPTRETERWISRLLSNDLPEIQELGEKIRIECSKVTPSLIKHVSANPFLNRKNSLLACYLKRRGLKKLAMQDSPVGVYLNSVSDVEIEVAYNLINSTGLVNEDLLVEGEDTLDKIFDLAFTERGKFDEFPEECSVGQFCFEIICDIGAYRDIQRHRKGTQIVETWNSFRGYSLPDVLDDASLSTLKAKYISIFDKVSDLNKKLIAENNNLSEYCLLLGHNVRLTYICDFKQLAYFIELRSGEAGHYSYRRVAQAMYKLVEKEIPNLAKHIRVNMNGYSDRRKQEEAIQEKIAKNLEEELVDFDTE